MRRGSRWSYRPVRERGHDILLRPYLDGIGKEIIEAAEIDGMGFWQIFFVIVIPLSKPALIAQFIFGFVGGYNNYGGALVYLETADPSMWTLQIALQQLIAYMSTSKYDYNSLCGCADGARSADRGISCLSEIFYRRHHIRRRQRVMTRLNVSCNSSDVSPPKGETYADIYAEASEATGLAADSKKCGGFLQRCGNM